MLKASLISTNLYTNNTCRKPCFKAGKEDAALYRMIDSLEKDLEQKRQAAIAAKETKQSLIQRFYNFFKSHRTNNMSRFAKIDSPIGKLKLSPEGIKQYAEVVDLYAEGLPQQNKYYDAKTKVIKAKFMMEVLGSLGELSTKYNDVIKSKTFGKIKVTEKGLKQYIDAMNLYAEAFPWQKIYPDKKQNVIKAEQMINIIKGNGELPENDA